MDPGSRSRMEKKSEFGMNMPDNFSGSLETVFWVKNTNTNPDEKKIY
jgi:hypothetical protein